MKSVAIFCWLALAVACAIPISASTQFKPPISSTSSLGLAPPTEFAVVQTQTPAIESDRITRNHLVEAAIIGAGVFALLAIAFLYLRIDKATRGFYSRRLQTAAVVGAIVVVVLCVWWFIQWVP